MSDWGSFAEEIFRIQRKSILPFPIRILIVIVASLFFPVFLVLERMNVYTSSDSSRSYEFGSELEDIMMTIPGADYLSNWMSNYYLNKVTQDIKAREKIPNHIGIIMDGNRRFARELSASREAGHALGAEKLEKVLKWAKEFDIRYGTFYAFSKENMERSDEEVGELMDLMERKFREIAKDPRIHKNKIKIKVIGNKKSLPQRVKDALNEAERKTKDYDNFVLNIAVNYGGREEIVEATRKISEKVARGDIKPEEIDEETFNDHLYMSGIPDPDLIIRTSGEERLSGFLLWKSAYSELYFCDANWPALTKLDFLQALYDYQERDRRFGR